MIDNSPAIKNVKKKVIYVRMRSNVMMVVSDGKNADGKWHIIDLCFGSIRQAVSDLKAQGYTVKKF